MGIFCPFLSDFLPILYIYATKNRIFMNKNAVLVGRGGFEPKRKPKKSLFFNAFSDYSPIFHQIIFALRSIFFNCKE